MTKSAPDLRKLLESIDRRSYPAYKDARGSYDFSDYVLTIDHVQGDPFASPSKLSIFIPHQKAGYPSDSFDTPWKQTALEDYLVRQFYQEKMCIRDSRNPINRYPTRKNRDTIRRTKMP